METRSMLVERLRQSLDWASAIDDLERELERAGSKPEQSESLFELAVLVEEVIPERDRALGLYQRAWKLHPDNLKALSRAREVYAEIGRKEMVAKLGEMELRSPAAADDLAAVVGEALLDSGQREKAEQVLARAQEKTPDLARVKDAVAALEFDPEFWVDEYDRLCAESERHDVAMAVRMLLRAARIMRMAAPDDPRLEGLLRSILEKSLNESSANYMLESLLAPVSRWDDISALHEQRVSAAATEAERYEMRRQFGLQWLQRFKDRDRAFAFFHKALQDVVAGKLPAPPKPIAMFLLVSQVMVDRNEGAALVALGEQLLAVELDDLSRVFIATRSADVALNQLGDVPRARALLQPVAGMLPRHPLVAAFIAKHGELEHARTPTPVMSPVASEPSTPVIATAASREVEAAPQGVPPAPSGPARRPNVTAPPPVVEHAAAPVPVQPASQSVSAPISTTDEPLTPEVQAAMSQARQGEGGPDKGLSAWKSVVAKHPHVRAPRRELARVLRANASWAQLAEALKDEEAKAVPASPDKASVWLEIAEVYGKLNNDPQVIAALTQALHHDGARIELYDQLAGLYEAKKRWPDMVKVLSEKAERIVEGDAKIAIYLQIANLYLERFSNQAEAIKAFERVLELDPNNATAVEHLLAVYEKRRDWEKLIRLKEVEIDRSPSQARAALVIEVAKLAATKVKKPEVCTHWWEQVLEYEPTHEEALNELYKLYERNKDWDKLAEVSSQLAESAPDDKARVEALQKLGLLYMERLENSDKAIMAWQRLLAVDENHRRAQDALKKLYVTDGRWDELEDFYRARGKMDEYIRVLEREVEAGAETHRLSLAMKIASLYRDELQKPDRAMRAYEKVLQLDEGNLEAAEALIPLYEAGRDPRRLVSVLEIQLDATKDAELRQERFRKLAEYNEEKLKDKPAAFGWWVKAFAEQHDQEAHRVELERLAADTGAWRELVLAYEQALPKFAHKADALPLMMVMARVVEREQGDIDRALDINRQILALDESNASAIEALERLYLGKAAYEPLLEIYRKKLLLANDADAQVAIHAKIGQLYEDEIKDDAKAIAAYQAILDAVGDEAAALGALDRIYTRTAQWAELADVLGRQLLLSGPDEHRLRHLETKYRLGQLRSAQLDDFAGAIDAFRDILDIEPGYEPARQALETLLAQSKDGEQRMVVASVLEPVYEQLGAWESLVGIHEIQVAAEPDRVRQNTLLQRIGELQRTQLGSADHAFDAYARSFAIDPSTTISKAQLEQLAPLVESGWARTTRLFEAALASGRLDPTLAHELSTKVAGLYVQQGNSAKAVDYYRQALTHEPEDVTTLAALETIFAHENRTEELLDIYRRRAEISAEPEARLTFLFNAAQLQESQGDATRAIATYTEILGQEPDEARALQALDRLYTQTTQWRDLGDNLTRQLLLVEDESERQVLLLRLAALRETHLGERAGAVETYRQVLEIQATEPTAVLALERLAADPELEQAVASILEPIYQATGNWQKQIGVYEIMVRHAFDPARKIELLHGIAELYEVGSGDLEQAFATHARALGEDARHEQTLGQLERLARSLGKWRELASLYQGAAQQATDDELKVWLFTRTAQIHELELRDDPAAVTAYEQVLAVSPHGQDAAAALQAIHERNTDWPALVAILRRRAELLADVAERKQLLLRAAQIEEEVLGNHDAAIGMYNQILLVDDMDQAAMDSLERLYVRLGQWAPLREIYGKRVELASEPGDKVRMLYVLAQVHDRELGDVPKAIETYQSILDIDADALPAIQSLDRLYGQAERWYDLLGNLERQVELAESSAEHVALKYRIGHLWQTRLGDLARAIESYHDALSIEPSHEETLAALEGLAKGKQEPIMAARVLEPIYEATSDYPRLVDVLEVMVAQTEDPAARVDLLHRIAQLQEQQLGHSQAAFDAYARALRDDSGNAQTLAQLERVAGAVQRFDALAQLYASEADKSLDVPRQVDLLGRLAQIQEYELQNPVAATTVYRRIIDVEFDHKPSLVALDRLYGLAGAWTELVDVLRREIQLAEGEQEILTLQFRLAQTLESKLGDRRSAVDVYREILAGEPTHQPTLDALEAMFAQGHLQSQIAAVLEPLYEATGEFEKLHGLYQVQLQLLHGTDRQTMYQQLGELAEHKLYDAMRAFAWWGHAHIEEPRWEHAADELARLAKATASWEEVVDTYGQVVAKYKEADIQGQALARMAQVYEDELRDVARAVETQLRVLELAPASVDALAALDRLYQGAGMYEDLAEILRRRIEVSNDPDEQVALLFRRGAVYADALSEPEASLACYEAVLDRESRNRDALAAVEGLHFRRQDWVKLRDTYEKLVDVADGDDELADTYARMAHLDSEALGQEQRAIELWGRVLDIRPTDETALGALANLHERRESWEELAETLERQIAYAQTPVAQIALYKRLGRLWSEKLGRERNAIDAWMAADQLDGHDMETLQALAKLYQETQSWEELSNMLRRILELGINTGSLGEDQAIALYSQLGQLEGDVLGRVDDAVVAWQHVIGIDPTDMRALAALENLFTREARWEDAIAIMEKRALVLDDEEARKDALLQAAATWEEKVENFHQAAAVYEQVRQAEPGHAVAAGRLEAIYRQQHRWPELVEVLLEKAELQTVTVERITLLNQVAEIYETELGDQESAFVVLQAAFKLDYANEETAAQLERLASSTNKWQELLDEYTNRVNELEQEDRGAAADLWVKIGQWYGEHLSHLEWAIHSVQQALRIDPSHTAALTSLAELQRKRGSWHELVDTLQRHAAVEPQPLQKVELYAQLGELLEVQIGDPSGAIAAYQQGVLYDGKVRAAGVDEYTRRNAIRPVLEALDRLYRRTEQWEALVETLGQRALLEDDELVVVRLRAEQGQILEQRLGDAGRAIAAYQKVLDSDPSNAIALRALETLYERTNQSEKYLEVLEAQLDQSPSDAERVALYERMSAAWEERFGKLDRAADCLEKIVAIDPRNYAAYRELARIYQQGGKFEALTETHRNHILATTDVPTRIELYCAMGAIYEQQLGDTDRAIEAYTDVLTFAPDEPRALDALGGLYEKICEWDRAVETMAQLVRITDEVPKQVDLFWRMGRVQYSQLGDAEAAEANFLRGLSINGGHVRTMEDLVQLYSHRGDWLKAAQMMVRAESYTPVVLDKVRLLNDAAHIFHERLHAPQQAKELYAAVIALDPEHVEAGAPLAQLYFEAGEWAKLSPVIDMMVRKTAQTHPDPRLMNDLYYRAARTAAEVGENNKALTYYKAAYEIDATHLPTLMGRADLLFKMQDWDGAGKIYQTILVQHRDSQPEAEVVRIYFRLGMVRQALGERKKALNMFEKALELDPNHRETLLAVVEVQQAQGDWEAVVHAKRALLATTSAAERVTVLDQIGSIYREKLANPQKATAAYVEALEAAPDDHQLLQKLVELYTETKQWRKLVEVIQRFIALEPDPTRKGTYYHAAATVCRDELKSLDEAVEYYNHALDAFFGSERISDALVPRALKAFEAIDRILTSKKDYKAQERAYRDMIKRMPTTEESMVLRKIRVNLLDGLGEIYRTRLRNYQTATEVFQFAQQLDPQNELRADGTDRAEILAELYLVAGPDYADKAIEQHMRMLKAEPFKYDSYKALRRIYMESNQYDKTWCLCNTLAFLKKADPEELQFYEQYKPRSWVKAKNAMGQDAWTKLVHSDENRYISAIFAAVWQGVAMMKSYPHKDAGIKRKDKLVLPGDLMFSKLFYYAAQVMNVPLPEVYIVSDNKPADIQLANFAEKDQLLPSFLVRPHLLQGKSEREIAFLSARRLTYLRPEYYLKLLLPTNTELKVAMMSAIALVNPRFPIPPDAVALVQQYMPEMQKRIPPAMLEQLAAVVNRFIQAAPEVNLAAWGHAVDAVSHRAGFVVCGDLEVAARMVSAEPVTVGGPQVKDKIKELVLFSISENYFAVRAQMGLTIAG